MTPAGTSVAPADLTLCDREPIHIPGSIQPHGFLIAAEEGSRKIRSASANVEPLLGLSAAALLGRRLDDVIGAAATARLQEVAGDPLFTRRAVYVDRLTVTVRGVAATFVLVAHRQGGSLIVEGELLQDRARPRDTHYQLETFLSQMEGAPSLPELLQLAVAETRRITGFDRVMVYQFDAEWNGLVIAEDRNDRLPSYLDLRFPASDIPRQARELYRINRLRLIASASYQPVPLLAVPNSPPLDLSLSILRSVSPVHLEYMRNMGTGSSMSISLMRGGSLWGLISCHAQEPAIVPFEVRSTCDLLGQVLSLQLAARENAAMLRYRVELRTPLATLLTSMARSEQFAAGLMAEPKALLQLTAATGVAVVADGDVQLHGRTPTKPQVEAIVSWLLSEARDDVYATESLSAVFPEGREFAWSAAGMLAISISRIRRSLVMWFRPEVIATVTWGGDPYKPAETQSDGSMRIHPRKSFETWVETVRGRAMNWQPAEVEAARELRAAVIEIVLQSAERLAQLTEELTRTNKELETFSYTVSHDLRAPFRHIRAYAELLKIDKARMLDEEGRQFLDHVLDGAAYAGRLVDNILAFSQMGRSPLHLTTVDMDEMVPDVIHGLELETARREIEWTLRRMPKVEGDASMLRTVVQNLLENAIKFTRERKPARIEITAQDTADEHVISVRDNGVGFDAKYRNKLFGMFQRLHRWEEFEGTGIGLASVRRIVGRHGGRVWAESELHRGATFYFSLPKVPVTSSPLYA